MMYCISNMNIELIFFFAGGNGISAFLKPFLFNGVCYMQRCSASMGVKLSPFRQQLVGEALHF